MATAGKIQAAASRPETAKPRTAAPPAGGAVPHEKIAERAHQIWQAAGRTDGHDREHWFQAERELLAERPVSRTGLR